MNRISIPLTLSLLQRSLVPRSLRRASLAQDLQYNACHHARLSTTSKDGRSQQKTSVTVEPKELCQDDQYSKKFSFGESFLQALGQVYQDTNETQLSPNQLQEIETEAINIMKEVGDPGGSISRTINYEFMAYMVAPYRVLKANGTSLHQIRRLLEESLQRTLAWSSQIVREQLDSSPDAFKSLVQESKDKEQNFYQEPDFKLGRARDEPDSYSLEVHKCWYMDTLQRLDAREIGPSFCSFDRSWYDPIDPDRHGVKFTRPSTIAEGADRCRFNIDRVKKQ
ncbi:hypothetical protein NCS57_00020700 [Fusarium keratoplasticum]|uniref:Uncharacterized protein n=1 Tax=Fusarium keratoplasticum TaxID=1328300 RepID=A0ACC0RCP3_9HYPO|nr:hypothetical protein NCS57_00020700 [Fusarium keratoplasticum]KAI8683562.1 hypothetical protein NCS57_00020700 [Fusarium keratoplasticum]